MSNENSERDNHFQGFAELLRRDLSEIIDEPLVTSSANFEEFDQKITRLKQILARRAYDLAAHVIWQCPISDYEFDMRNVPDLTEWPDTSS